MAPRPPIVPSTSRRAPVARVVRPIQAPAQGDQNFGDEADDWYNKNFGTTVPPTTIPSGGAQRTVAPGTRPASVIYDPGFTIPPGTVRPTTPTTTIPPTTEKPLSQSLDEQITNKASQLVGTSLTAEERAAALKGKKPDKGFWRTVGKVVGAGLNYTVLRPINQLGEARRTIISGINEINQFAREKVFDDVQRYGPKDYIPIHPQTQMPIAKIGDPVINNVTQVLRTPIPEDEIDKITTVEEAQAATDRIVKNTATRVTASFTDFLRAPDDPEFGFGDIARTGNKWVDRTVGFVGDVLFDPITYLSGGTAIPAKYGLSALTRVVGREASQELVQRASTTIVQNGLRATTKQLAEEIATATGEKVGSKVVQQSAAAAAVSAAQLAAEEATEAATKKAAEKLTQSAISRWSAVGPARQLGAGQRAATATVLQDLRNEAAQEALEFAGTAQGRVAQKFVDTITDDVIAKVAVKGPSEIVGPVAEALGVKGGLRWGLPGMRLSIGGSQMLTQPVGQLASGIRRTVVGGPFLKLTGRALADLTTPIGGLGRVGSRDIFDARFALRTGMARTAQGVSPLSTQQALKAVDTLAQDQFYKGFKSSAGQTINQAVRKNLGKKEYRALAKTVYQLFELPEGTLSGTLEEAAQKATTALKSAGVNRTVTTAEVAFARAIQDLGDQLDTITKNLRVSGSTLRDPSALPPTKWFPTVLSENALRYLSRINDPKVLETLRVLGLNTAPMPGQFIPNGLFSGRFFGKLITGDETLTQLNKIARDAGFKGNFFDTNAFSAIDKFGKKFADDYAFLRLVDYYSGLVSEGQVLANRSPFLTGAIAQGQRLGDTELTQRLTENLPEWAFDDMMEARAVLGRQAREAAELGNTAKVDSINEAIAQVDSILNTFVNAQAAGDDIANAWFSIGDDLQRQYGDLFSLPPKQVNELLNNIDPRFWKTIANTTEDAFVALDSVVAPDAFVRSDLAQMYANVRRLKDPKVANPLTKFVRDFNTFLKTWVTTTPQFHVVNAIGNAFQMIAGGASPKFMNEARILMNEWNSFLTKELADAGDDFVFDIDELVDIFANNANIKKIFRQPKGLTEFQKNTFKDALRFSGASGFGDVEEVLSRSGQRVGILGREVAERQGVGRAVEAVSGTAGRAPQLSRKVGQKIETMNRFMMTYDGIRQGLSAQQSAERTARFLIDYADLTTADEFFRQIIPFWMWMSRNLPVQITNMWTRPQVYAMYEAFRRNFEDENGDNVLVPGYLKEAGATVVGRIPEEIFGVKVPESLAGVPLALRPDLGFPGTGAPSPLTEGVTDPRALIASTTPLARLIPELTFGQKAFSGQELEGFGEKAQYAGQQLLPPVGVLGRYAAPFLAGTENPLLQAIGVPGPGEQTPEEQRLRALAGITGSPIRPITTQEENARRFELLRILNEILQAERNR